jgi:hypothetical protein
MQAFAIPRTDPGAEGIEVLWTWPDNLPLSTQGYDVLRLDGREIPWQQTCETIGAPEITSLRTRFEIAAPLGALRLRRDSKLAPISAAAQQLAQAATHAEAAQSAVVPAAMLAGAVGVAPAAVAMPLECYIQELTQPADRATVSPVASAAMAIALVRGKAVASGLSGAGGSTINLAGAGIDTILLYTVGVTSFTICTFVPAAGKDDPWSKATVVAKGLTLPIKECDPSLATPAQELATAQSRLVGTETLDPARFQRMCTTLRGPAAGATLGRNGARLSLNRSDATQSFEELPLDLQLAALVLHPRGRRVLGFGHHDRKGLIPGHSYIYRVVGRFDAADLSDTIYDVHRIPAGTVLPDNFWISDVGFQFQTPVKVVLDPAPAAAALHATSRRGIRIDTTGFDASWLLPSYGGWSALVTLPNPVTQLALEVAPGHHFSYAAGLPWAFGSPPPLPLPAGPLVNLTFPSAIQELRLSGIGTLYALRLPSGGKGTVTIHADAPPVLYAAQPLPAPPLVLLAVNLQQPPAAIVGAIDESTPVPPRHPVGFKLVWLPAPSGNPQSWPQDLDSGPPLDSMAYAIDHRTVVLPATFGPWEPINADDNLTFGSRGTTPPTVRLEKGCDLDKLFPQNRPRDSAGLTLSYSDVFGEKDPRDRDAVGGGPAGEAHAAALAHRAAAASRARCQRSPAGSDGAAGPRHRQGRGGAHPSRHRHARRAPECDHPRMGLASIRARSRPQHGRVPSLHHASRRHRHGSHHRSGVCTAELERDNDHRPAARRQ